MALSAADFYAYSRATGAPYPEDPEERAEMAPEVLEFRRNQLRAPEQGPNLLETLGLGALAAGGLAGIGFGARRFLRGSAQKPVSVAAGITKKDLAKVATAPSVEPKQYVQPSKVVGQAQEVAVPTRREAAIPEATVDLTTLQQVEEPVVVNQQNQANDTGVDQAVARISTQVDQRDVDTTRTGMGGRQQRLMTEYGQVGAAKTDLNDPLSSLKRASYLFEQSDLSGGLPPGLEEQAQAFIRQQRYRSPEGVAQRAAQEALAIQKSKAPQNAKVLQNLGPQLGLSQEEIFHRISASASEYKPGSMEPLTQLDVAALLDPSVPTKAVSDLLGTTLAVRGGRVGRNLDYEVMAEGAGITGRKGDVEVTGEFGSDVYAYNPNTGNFEIDTTSDLEDLNLSRGRTSDYESSAADYGDVEGPGGFVATRSFEETTKGGKSIIPGIASEAEGMVPGSRRQLREVDRVIPARETLEGDPAAGWTFDPRTGRAVLVGAGKRLEETRTNVAGKPIKVVQAGGRARELGAYKGRISVDDPSYDPTSGGKLPGRYQPATTEVSPLISTQPVTEYKTVQERLLQDDKGNWWVDSSKKKKVGEEQLRGLVGSDPNLRDISLDRNEINSVINKAAERWNTVNSKGELSALQRQEFLIDNLNSYLVTQKRITLPVLQRTKKGGLPAEAFAFIKDVQPGMQVSDVYVRPAKVSANNRPLMISEGKKQEPLIDPKYAAMDPVPLPGFTKVTGTGGVEARTVDTETYEGDVSFFSPTVETAPQVIRDRRTGQLLTTATPQAIRSSTGAQLANLRAAMETPQTGEGLRTVPVVDPSTGERIGTEKVSGIRIGSFARTQNPYTGKAAPTMGPASRVLTGDYQYTPQQLYVDLTPNIPEAGGTIDVIAPQLPFEVSTSAEEYRPSSSNVDVAMQKLLAQGKRRRAKR
jgi:hypothetical protein